MDLHDMARAWLDQDPDPATRSELQRLIETNDAELADCFAGRLHFGTAGLRGPLGPGPNRMNRVVVLQSAAGLARRGLRAALTMRKIGGGGEMGGIPPSEKNI